MKQLKVTIDNDSFLLNVQAAVAAGILVPVPPPYPLCAGDVYKPAKGGCNPFLLVRVAYYKDEWQLLGMGASTNSNEFFSKTHTKAEVETYLRQHGMVFDRNINRAIGDLVDPS